MLRFVRRLSPVAVSITILLTLCLVSCSLLTPEEHEEKDKEDPVITLRGDDPDTAFAGVEYDDPGCRATDNEDGTITSSVDVDYGTLDIDDPETGTYTVTYSVEDEAGNSDEVERTVVIIKKSDITITSTTISDASDCPLVFDDTSVVYTISSSLTITSSCKVTFGAHTKFIIESAILVEDGGTLTILEGAQLAFEDNAYIRVGADGNGTLKAIGTEDDTIRFITRTAGTRWGYGTSANYAGGFWFNDAATAACSLVYCSIDSATAGIYAEKSSLTISHCRISNHQYSGCVFADEGAPIDSAHFVDNVITGNGEYGIYIYANYAGALSGTGSVADNEKGGIFIKGDYVEEDAIWKKHDAEYVVDGTVDVGNESGATLTIRPGAKFQLKDNAYFAVGVSGEGAIIADGTEEDSIRFVNYTAGTKWGFGTSAGYSGGFKIDDMATSACSFTYCTIDSATSGMYIADATATISHCRISGNDWYGIYCDDGGTPTDSAGFVDNIITGNGEFGMALYANFVGALSGTGSFDDNESGGILIISDKVETDAIWKKHDAPYAFFDDISVGSESGAILTIRPGCEFQAKSGACFTVGVSEMEGAIIANGTEEDSIRFSNYSAGTNWGFGTSASYSGGFRFDDAATAACSLTYCTIDSATSGIYINNSSVTISHCRIEGNKWYGIYCDEDGSPSDSAGFLDNVITGNGKFGVSLDANFVGALSGTGSFDGNTKGGFLVRADEVVDDAVWKKHDVPYVIGGQALIESAGGVTITIRPGAEFLLQDNGYFNVGANEEGTLIAEGTESDSIRFSPYSSGTAWGFGTSANYSGGFRIDGMSANTSLSYCMINGATSGIYVEDAEPSITNCSITDCDWWGIYLENSTGANISDISFSGNGSGETGTSN